jgi:16S rRNA (guanine527-N7)-methyltransferase
VAGSRSTGRELAGAVPFPVKRLEFLCAESRLPPRAAPMLEVLLRLLERSPDAPSSVTDPSASIDVHVADSLSGLDFLRYRPSLEAIADLGSGAGFPGLPLAIGLPEVRIDLLEATRRKCAFLERAIAEIELENARVVCRRAEEWGGAEGRGQYEAVTVRAVGRLPTIVEYAAPLLRDGGLLVAWRGRRDRADEDAGAGAAALLGLRPLEIVPVEPFPGAGERYLHTYERIAALPHGYPRRVGVARKRPLGV